MYVCMYVGLEVGGIASLNANHFWGNCESLWQSDSPNFLALRITFGRLRITFQMDSSKDFFSSNPFLDKISPLLQKFYV